MHLGAATPAFFNIRNPYLDIILIQRIHKMTRCTVKAVNGIISPWSVCYRSYGCKNK